MRKKPPDFKYRGKQTKQASWISVREFEMRNQSSFSVVSLAA